MGGRFSCLTAGDGGLPETGLGDIPESCLASVFTYLSPADICRLARLNRSFRGASSADFVWELKLPANYRYLLKEMLPEDLGNRTKKEIYALLSQPTFLDGGRKVAWLKKTSGTLCLAISAKAMSITGIDDRRYWNYLPSDESRLVSESLPNCLIACSDLGIARFGFHEFAYMQQVWWLQVDGELEFHFPPGRYSLYFRLRLGFKFKRLGWFSTNNFEHVHGWDVKPVRFQFSTSDGQASLRQRYLEAPDGSGTTTGVRGDWTDYHIGDFVVQSSTSPMKIKFSMMQIDCTHTKGGLCIDSVSIVPADEVIR